jgi:hypothetical protein
VGRHREVGVAAQQHVAEASPPTQRNRMIQRMRRPFVRGAIASAIDEEQWLARVSEGHEERVVSPDAREGEIHALLALARRGNERAVRVDARRAPRDAAATPHAGAHLVDRVHQAPHRRLVEAPEIVAGRGGVRNRSCPERVEERGIVTSELDVFQHLAAAEQIERDVEDVIGISIRPRGLQNAGVVVDRRRQAYTADEPQDCANPVARNRARPLSQLVRNPAGSQPGFQMDSRARSHVQLFLRWIRD